MCAPQGTLIQHLKEHVLHGDMTSGDVLLYYTTVSTRRARASAGRAARGRAARGRCMGHLLHGRGSDPRGGVTPRTSWLPASTLGCV